MKAGHKRQTKRNRKTAPGLSKDTGLSEVQTRIHLESQARKTEGWKDSGFGSPAVPSRVSSSIPDSGAQHSSRLLFPQLSNRAKHINTAGVLENKNSVCWALSTEIGRRRQT